MKKCKAPGSLSVGCFAFFILILRKGAVTGQKGGSGSLLSKLFLQKPCRMVVFQANHLFG